MSGAPDIPTPPVRSLIPHGLRALRVRNYRRYWLGQLVSQTGSWMQTTAQGWLVLTLTDSPFAVGLVTTFQFVPVMLLSLPGGLLGDAIPRRKLLLVTQGVALLQAAVFGLLVGSGWIRLWHVYVLAAVQGTVQAVDTPARQAFTSDLVGREDVVSAVSLNSMLFNAARIVGPSVAGVLIGGVGIPAILYANAASYLAVLWVLFTLDAQALPGTRTATGRSLWQDLPEGLRYVLATPEVWSVLALVAVLGTFGYNWNVALPLLSKYELGLDARGLGALWTSLGVGSLVGAASTAFAAQVTPRRMVLAAAGFSALLAALALSDLFEMSVGLLVLLGFAGIVFTTSANSLLQLTVPERLRGRVMSLYFLLFVGSTPLGGLVLGGASGALGVKGALLLCSALCLLGVGSAELYRRRAARGAALNGRVEP
ncbi:MAG TPA: MFS transporter [Archangium sp.]|nr:MFS transporter [Archangium sp.]